jgi:hypothetical protein
VVYSTVSPDQDPKLSVHGQLGVEIPAGQVLILVTHPHATPRDSLGGQGSNNYYVASSPVTVNSSGCWADDDHPLGYSGAGGISEGYYLVLVTKQLDAQFLKDKQPKGWDGYSASTWSGFTKTVVIGFVVPTQ